MLRRVLPPVLVTVTVLVGCSSGADRPSRQADASGTPSPTASDQTPSELDSGTPSAAPAPRAPRPDGCYRISVDEAEQPSSDERPVRCSSRHTGRTIHVGRLRTVVDGHALAVDSDRVQQQVATTCRRELAARLGGSEESRRLSRFEVVWFSPAVEQSDQ